MRRRRLRFTGQLLVLQLAVVAAVVLVGFGLFATMLDRGLRTGYGDRALAIARSMAADDEVRALVAGYSADHRAGPNSAVELERGPIQRDAEAVRELTGALFVVVTDDRGIRLAHPQPAELGRPVSTDPSVALAGREEIVEQRGTLGESARAKVPVLAPGGTDVVGAVSVGIGTDEISAALWSDLRVAALYAAAALGLGVFASILLSRRLRRLTLGVEPEELAAMASEHEAVLGSISEAVVGVDPHGRIGVANGEARRLFGDRVRPGEMADAVGLPNGVLTVIREMSERPPADRVPTDPFLVLAGERVLICSVGGVTRDGRDLGVVLSARDRTDVEALTRQLDAVQTMGSALRAQRHEFANRLHVVHGLLDHGHLQEATEYVRSVLGAGPLGTLLEGLETVRDPTLQAFLAAKAAHARERSVTLRLGPETWLDRSVTDPVAVTTVVGNLLDNAVDAAAEGTARSERWVEIELLADAGTLFVTVADSGDGVPKALRESLFQENVSSHPAGESGGRGLGLALVRQIARVVRGDVWLADPGGGQAGAVFVARLPGAVTGGRANVAPAGDPAEVRAAGAVLPAARP
ncbi:sensor histidine kinase [Nakamurella sp. GG22]